MLAMLNLKPFSSTTYAKYAKFINEKSSEIVKNIDAPAAVVEFYATKLNRKPDENGILDIDVSFDGSWHTRGHKSLLETGAIIDADTGLVLDYENLSKFCTKCNIKNAELKKKKITEEQHEKWTTEHASVCSTN
ncbi:hypothetical protein Pcinc_003106 [Petrolisthes cinctipes]|uniref:Mutator-like transposase domain-containing protein n=1 Tax=Petrolisthes cinctipes TaxID=88211 RepID=A0AAE1GJI8_PETCI|nr:hypothetical protein Pcinc_003106 [Petrolisthes cinctipes]